ncbi:LEAF RUST 10 DISEASE-RESISTANCE LOCUS RECEPTOR-LIKE PROTEIN KINASE-like 1.1 isoform X3 [Daucus carota subsp. sativus]|uniref:LEAF RUST 10 DISEASE-RESISTANCE LOCUS RECEPTOR-LIKE PROTEIN KINASE-like 1.1 isoform X3 n=1 Tax=Daucus carota subsp. sativus TaxID=79200 RepID=UPI0007F0140B|nr:PREDICTED: LEAF RUST 10 DISEASE-RESISTANCE LOCUS RECEPTOR-LIKE PROTEIN KINASE-like 1.1 isoform X3 [Daucus carota subsp. sativus]
MHAKLLRARQFFSNPISIIVWILCLSVFIPRHNAKVDLDMYNNCSKPTTSPCGTPLGWGVDYPFWVDEIRPSYCGLEGYKLSCKDDGLVVDLASDIKYNVEAIDPFKHTIDLNFLENPLKSICDASSSSNQDTEHNHPLLSSRENSEVIYLFYNCSDPAQTTSFNANFRCGNKDPVYFFRDELFAQAQKNLSSCNYTWLPVNKWLFEKFIWDPNPAQQAAEKLFEGSFEVYYNVENNQVCKECYEHDDGVCWKDTYVGSKDPCLYRRQSGLPYQQQSGSKKSKGLIIGAAAIGGVGILLFLMAVVFILYRRKNPKQVSYAVSRNVSSYSFSMSDSEKGSGTYMGVRTFSYNELEKATNNFDASNELGDGGFGTVYKGKLQDGREVAVKRLYENSMKRVEQFMNEIVILTQLRHPNLVVLYGSTSQECRKLLLVYEYIPNGTIADHLYGEDAERGKLTWKTRMSIAIQTASALSYLHVSDVIHRDVKTTNILLDDNFHVKVADFGLSRLFPVHATHVSTAPQGTPGYVDPEYHQCYQLTSKSDVYSFGVVLIELISSKPAVDITRHRHEINLANLAINKIQGNALHELVDPSLGFESDYEVKRMITEVAELAFRCLQNDRELRPSMDEVHKSLKEIQSRNYSGKHETEHNLSADHVSLLKNYPQNHSPDSVTIKWGSNSTNTSSSN